MRHTNFGYLFIVTLFLLAWCTKTVPSSIPEKEIKNTIKTSNAYKKTWVEICDKYLSIIRCISNASEWNKKIQYQETHDNLINSRENIPVDQLNPACNWLYNNLIQNPEILQQTNCKI